MSTQSNNEGPAAATKSGVDRGRRAAIAKMGGIAAPAFVLLLTADASEAWSASGRPGRPRPPRPRPPSKPRRPRRVVGRIVGRFF
jgi:hypothetical protein